MLITEPPVDSDEVQPVRLNAEEFSRETARLINAAPNNRQVLRETDTAFVAEQIEYSSADRLELKVFSWRKNGFDRWWQEESRFRQTGTAVTLKGLSSPDKSSLSLPLIMSTSQH